MITKQQIDTLSKQYQIDGFTIMREYLQLLFLSYLYQNKKGRKIYFKGGTAIRLLFGSSRFSEDLDFSTLCNKKQIKDIIKQLEKAIQQEIPELKILLLYSGRTTTRFRIKYQSTNFTYPFVIRLDFHHVKRIGKNEVSPLVTKFPMSIFPLVSHLSIEEILAEKIQALATRGKGRDFFDVWYLLEKGITIKKNVNRKAVLKKIKQCSQTNLNRDLSKFLPSTQRSIIGLLKERLKNLLTPSSQTSLSKAG